MVSKNRNQLAIDIEAGTPYATLRNPTGWSDFAQSDLAQEIRTDNAPNRIRRNKKG